MRVANMEPLVKTSAYERGSYICFDPNTWETIRKDRNKLFNSSPAWPLQAIIAAMLSLLLAVVVSLYLLHGINYRGTGCKLRKKSYRVFAVLDNYWGSSIGQKIASSIVIP
ncbi:UNVERIFIED_CONTAM: putative NOT transcription complex subunit VIP2 [Sesamum angustifolium]|uniref:NOT transcription complex subunit VIP2 n=1 Tax=Sesamum angustifolium TaxID=2727405 RepID=A0AAW2QPV3_9LAMI